MIYYRSGLKEDIIDSIHRFFGPTIDVIDPATLKGHKDMWIYLKQVEKADKVVYVPIAGFITAGVYREVEHARRYGKKIFKYVDGKIIEAVDIDEDLLNIEETRKLYEILKYLDIHLLKTYIDKYEMEEDQLPRETIEKLYKDIEEFKPKAANLPPEKRWLHWWENYEGYKHMIRAETIVNHVYKVKDFYGITEEQIKNARKKTIKNKSEISTRDIKEFCDLIKLPYYVLDEVLRYPLDLSQPLYHKLVAHVVNEGNINKEKRRKSTYSCTYYNKDPALHKYVRSLGGYPSTPDKRYDVLATRIDRKYISPLLKLGVPLGHKGKELPKYNLRYLDEDTFKYYIQCLFTEEGGIKFDIQKGRWISLRLYWYRFIDITKYLKNPKKYIKIYGYGPLSKKKVNLKSPEISLIAYSIGHPYIEHEMQEICRRFKFPHDKINSRINRYLISKKDNGIRASWEVYISDNKYVKWFVKNIGFLPNTFKDYYSKLVIELFEKYEKSENKKEVIKEFIKLENEEDILFEKWIKNYRNHI